ncbi:MAG TPA: hypothetical protein VK856_03905 [Anaerolineaceae bacterium]|nr:hypothetical protein [Anaerolineaceae bacterium]
MISALRNRVQLNLPWLGILLLIILSIGFLLPVLPNDFWWYLRLGKDIVGNGSIPAFETYSSTALGQPVSYPMWLSAVFFYGLFQAGDLSLVVLLRGLLIGIFYLALWVICIRKGLPGWVATLLTLLCALAGANNWAVRPQMFVYPLFGLALIILNGEETQHFFQDSDDKTGHARFSKHFYWLIPISILWSNLHGSVIILFLLAFPYFLFNQRNRQFFIILCFIMLATFINPRGPLIWWDTVQIIQATGNQFSQEWKPPINSGWQMNFFFMWIILFVPLVSFSKNKLKKHEWIWFLGFGWMALTGTRYVIWFLALLLILTSQLLEGLLRERIYQGTFSNIKLNYGLLLIMVLLPTFLLPGIRENWWTESPEVMTKNTPIQATSWIQQNINPDDLIFNDYLFGSYMIYALPAHPVWIDSRFYPYPELLWQDYLSISNADLNWYEKLEHYQIDYLFLDNNSQKNLIMAIKQSKYYCQIYTDSTASIFSKCE